MALSKAFFNFLKKHNTETFEVNSLIVSSYLFNRKIRNVKNILINRLYKVSNTLLELNSIGSITTFEELIEAFEFVISPSDKILNGAVYTPKFIRNFIVEKSFEIQNKSDVSTLLIADISCGCGGFLLTVAEHLKKATQKSFFEIFSSNIYGIDIEKHSIERSEILLSLLAIENGEDLETFNFNLYQGNSLNFNWREANKNIANCNGFDMIVGNPPYVCSRNMDAETLEMLKNIEVSKSGHPDLYIPFFQIGIENLNPDGILGYITVNSFLKSINGRSLRKYFATNNLNLKILNFGGEQIFQDRNTYTCICFLQSGNSAVEYIRIQSSNLAKFKIEKLHKFEYKDLNYHDGWNLVNDTQMLDFVNIVENTGTQFKNIYNTKNGIATLKNDVYKFNVARQDNHFYYLIDNGITYPIEIEICRDIINANKLKESTDIDRLREKIIFPYDKLTRIIPENIMQRDFPYTYSYLETKKEILAKRDKGKRIYETWYAYGRRQSMDINAYKLFFPHICERPKFVLCEDRDLLFYNGIAIISNNLQELVLIKKIMESDLFYKYIKNTTKDYSSGYISMSRNYLKNFGIFDFTIEQEREFLSTNDSNKFLEKLYGVEIN